jgi:hypothetical protein
MTIVYRSPGVIACSFVDTNVVVSPNGKHRWEFSWRFGPLFVDKRGDPLKNQPMPGTARWGAFQTWYDEWRKTNSPPLGV